MQDTVRAIYATLMVLSSLGSILGNLVLLLVVLLNKELRSETLGLTLSFSLSDLALGLSTIPFGAHNSLFQSEEYPSEGALCQGSGFLFVLLQMSSIHSLTWATIDKFTEICFALSYASMGTARRTRTVLALVWLYCVVNASLPLLGFGRYTYSTTKFICAPNFAPANKGFNVFFIVVGIIAPILIMCSLYGYIVYIARKQVRRGTFMCNDQHCFYVPANNYFKSSVVMVVTSVCLLVCWLPYITVGFYETFTGQDTSEAASAFSTWLVLSTAALNPWVSSMTQTKYRSALKRSLSKICQGLQCSGKIPMSRSHSTATHMEMNDHTAKTSTSSLPPPSSSSSPQPEDISKHSSPTTHLRNKSTAMARNGSIISAISSSILPSASSSSLPGMKPPSSSPSPPPLVLPWYGLSSPSPPTTRSKPTSSSLLDKPGSSSPSLLTGIKQTPSTSSSSSPPQPASTMPLSLVSLSETDFITETHRDNQPPSPSPSPPQPASAMPLSLVSLSETDFITETHRDNQPPSPSSRSEDPESKNITTPHRPNLNANGFTAKPLQT